MSTPPRRLRGRRHLPLAITVAVIAPLAACSAPADEGPVTLTFQTWVPGIDQAVDLFNEQHDDIQVELQTIVSGAEGGYAKMLSDVQAGNPADVAQVGYDQMPTFLLNGALEDITDYVGDDVDVFSDWQIGATTFSDRVYGIPQAAGPMGLYYRSDVFAEAGITEAPATWDDFYAAAVAVRATAPDRYIAAFAPNQAAWMEGLAEQAGEPWFQVEGDAWKVAIDNPDTLRMAEYWQRLIDEDLVKVQADLSSEWFADVQAGRIVSWMSGSWADAIIRNNAPETSGLWSVGLMPQWDAANPRSASWSGGSANVVLKGSAHPEQAAEFALWLNSNLDSVSLLTENGAGWPAIADVDSIPSIQSASEVFEFFGGQDIWDVFAESNEQVARDWQWPPLVDALNASLLDEVAAAVESGTPLTEAYAKVQERMVAEMTAKGISVAD